MKLVVLDFGDIIKEAQRLKTGARAALDTLPAMREIGVDMLVTEERIFESQGRRGGGSWAVLKEDTVRKKGNTRILFTAGSNASYKRPEGADILFNSMTKADAPYNIMRITKTFIDFGSDRPFGFVHQFGSTKRNIPRRPFLNFTPFDIDRWRQQLYNHLLRPFARV